jgi:hypothetical protein
MDPSEVQSYRSYERFKRKQKPLATEKLASLDPEWTTYMPPMEDV